MEDQNIASWNRVAAWLRRIEGIYKRREEGDQRS
jgi:hypothetical protein